MPRNRHVAAIFLQLTNYFSQPDGSFGRIKGVEFGRARPFPRTGSLAIRVCTTSATMDSPCRRSNFGRELLMLCSRQIAE